VRVCVYVHYFLWNMCTRFISVWLLIKGSTARRVVRIPRMTICIDRNLEIKEHDVMLVPHLLQTCSRFITRYTKLIVCAVLIFFLYTCSTFIKFVSWLKRFEDTNLKTAGALLIKKKMFSHCGIIRQFYCCSKLLWTGNGSTSAPT